MCLGLLMRGRWDVEADNKCWRCLCASEPLVLADSDQEWCHCLCAVSHSKNLARELCTHFASQWLEAMVGMLAS